MVVKEFLDERSRDGLISYRLDRSGEALQETSLLSEKGYYNAAVNRLYYACYYAISALLLSIGVNAQTHAGVKTMFGLHVISKGLLPNEYGKTFSRLFEIRHSGDYDDFVYCDRDIIEEYYPKAQALVENVQRLLSNGPLA